MRSPQRLHEEGATVVVADLQGHEAAAEELGGLGLRVDVSQEADVAALAAAVLERYGRIDALVNNAGIYSSLVPKPFEQIDVDEWRQGLRRQRARHVPRHARRRARDARRGLRADRQHRLRDALQGRSLPAALRHEQGRGRGDDARSGQGGRRGRHPRQHRRARLHDVRRRAREPGAGRSAAGGLAQGAARSSATSSRATSSGRSRSSARRMPTSSRASRSWSMEGRTSTDGYFPAGRRAPRRGRAAAGDARALRRPCQHGQLQHGVGSGRGQPITSPSSRPPKAITSASSWSMSLRRAR